MLTTKKTQYAWLALPCLLLCLLVTSCASLKKPTGTPDSHSLPPASKGKLANLDDSANRKQGDSSFQLLAANKAALDWRLALCDHATTSLDLQYYIWQNDETGTLLFLRLLKAADRGVRVRLLVDDLAVASSDKNLAALSQHPNLEIRLFNANSARLGSLSFYSNFLLNFRQLNRRMHNKMMVADNQVGIIGGRDIGNEYFGVSRKYNFRDMDVVVAGPVVPEISRAFDDYWNHEAAYPAHLLSFKANADDAKAVRKDLNSYITANSKLLASYPIHRKNWSTIFNHFARKAHTGEAHFLQDDPVNMGGTEVRLIDMIDYMASPSHEELLAVSPYTLPVPGFLESLQQLNDEGVEVQLITGGMESNNHTVAHSHYKKYRKKILATGTQLKEYRGSPGSDERQLIDAPPIRSEFVALHVKTLIGDRRLCFIGSLNLDPRALIINTENGLLIDSPSLAKELAEQIDSMASPENSWSVTKTSDNKLQWKSSIGTVNRQPARSFGQRLADFFFQFLPIESQL
ncbi:MAG: phospholipase D family protein [Verrucomicrobia bacterium]|nr:phospholipase D family protein [Verrucomicrobiota bacterium]